MSALYRVRLEGGGTFYAIGRPDGRIRPTRYPKSASHFPSHAEATRVAEAAGQDKRIIGAATVEEVEA